MSKRAAGLAFLAVCLVLAVLLLAGTISPIASGILFAAALDGLGLLSRGLTKEK